MTNLTVRTVTVRETPGSVYCPLCTHTVDAQVLVTRKGMLVKPGQKCARCSSTLDAGYVLNFTKVAA
jgi:hypothetical protein